MVSKTSSLFADVLQFTVVNDVRVVALYNLTPRARPLGHGRGAHRGVRCVWVRLEDFVGVPSTKTGAVWSVLLVGNNCQRDVPKATPGFCAVGN